MATRLFVGNLPDDTVENDLRSIFSQYGEVTTLDLKSKSATENERKKFAFVSISASNHDVESCIKHFSTEDFKGCRLYVTRARESFLERLQRERAETQKKKEDKVGHEIVSKDIPVIKLGDKLNPRKRKIDSSETTYNNKTHNNKHDNHKLPQTYNNKSFEDERTNKKSIDKVHESEMKRIESLKKKRQEFKQKQMIIKTGLNKIDAAPNKKFIFTDDDDTPKQMNGDTKMHNVKGKKSLFDDDNAMGDSDDEVNFEIKKQFEGKKGQKVLDLQSRYKSDKRFILDERFIEEDENKEDKAEKNEENTDEVNELTASEEKSKQLDILQDVLGVSIKRYVPEDDSKKTKPKLGMLRFDPTQPEHAKFLAPVEETKQEPTKKKKKKDKQQEEVKSKDIQQVEEKVEVSKEQFYKVSETLKEAIAKPNTFSLRSLFGNANEDNEETVQQDSEYVPLQPLKEPKVKNPLDPGQKNPFVYDSSDSENEEEPEKKQVDNIEPQPVVKENKAVWKENLFFVQFDQRLKDGLAFFNDTSDLEVRKERRELKSLMKKRIYNKERKNQMFQKKIGGRRKTMKKSYKKKS